MSKLIRVATELYRTDDGITIFKQRAWNGKPAHWVMQYQDGLGAKVERQERTLKDCKQWLAGPRN